MYTFRKYLSYMLRNHIKKLMLLQTSFSRDFDIYSSSRAMQLTVDLL